MLGAQQAVEDLFHHDGIQFDELWKGLDHFFLQGEGRGGRSDAPQGGSDAFLRSLPLLPQG